MFELSIYQLQVTQQFGCEYIAFTVGNDMIFDINVPFEQIRALDSDHVDVEDFWRSPRIKVVGI